MFGAVYFAESAPGVVLELPHGAAAVHGGGALALTATVARMGAGAIYGGGALSTTGTAQRLGTAQLHGGGAVTGHAMRGAESATVAHGGGALSLTGMRGVQGAAAVRGGGAVTGTGATQRQASLPMGASAVFGAGYFGEVAFGVVLGEGALVRTVRLRGGGRLIVVGTAEANAPKIPKAVPLPGRVDVGQVGRVAVTVGSSVR